VTRTVWLASYPKSGNTWLRILIGNLWADGRPIGLNQLPRGSAGDRSRFDRVMLIDSGLLTHDEVDRLRPRAYAAIARPEYDYQMGQLEGATPTRLVKVHDAYTINPIGEPLLGGADGARGAIVVVRDPRDIASSLAHHMNFSIDEAIAFMNDDDAAICKKTGAQDHQLRQKLRNWSAHTESWLDQTDIPAHLIRYEDLRSDTPGTLRRALAFAGLSVTEEKINQAVGFSDFAVLREQEEQNGFREAPRTGVKFFRRGEAGNWRDELTRQQVLRIEAQHARVMLRLGYELSCVSELARPPTPTPTRYGLRRR